MLEKLRENAAGTCEMRALQISHAQAFTFIILELTEILSNPNVTLKPWSGFGAAESNVESDITYFSCVLDGGMHFAMMRANEQI